MAIGDITQVPDRPDLRYVDVGLYGVPGYGSVYVLDADRPAVVDPGIGKNVDLVVDAVESAGIDDLDYVLTTHVHLDHAGGAGYLAEEYPGATVVTHDIGAPHLVNPSRLVAGTKAAVGDQWKHYVDPKPIDEERIEHVADGDAVDLGDRTVDVVHAPGHAPHQVLFHDRGSDALFAGDAAGLRPPGGDEVHPTSPPANFDLEACLDDTETITDRDPELLCYGHFGAVEFHPSLMETYRTTLAEWVDRIREVRADLDDDEAVIEHFVEAAETVDPWGPEKTRAEVELNVRGVLGHLDRDD